MNPLQAIPASWRFALYVVYGIAGPVLIWTSSRGWTGEAEYALWIGLGSVFGFTAAANVDTKVRGYHSGVREEYDPKHDKP